MFLYFKDSLVNLDNVTYIEDSPRTLATLVV